jgi:hypothetical protein
MTNKILKINIFTFILFFILLLTLEIDYITYFFNTPYLLTFIISLIFNIGINYFILKKIEIVKSLNKSDIIFFVFLFFLFIITIVYPDRSFDTFNYHLYLQENPFGNKIGYDFFAGKNLNSFSYAFPDRVFYIFRYFLGYRLGVIINYLFITVIYTQVKDILKKFVVKEKDLLITIISTLIVITVSLVDIMDSYYVDLLSLVLLLEIFRLVLNVKIDNKNSSYLLGYLALLFGFAVVTKISNLPILAFLFIAYIIRNKNIIKCLNIKNILTTLLLLVLPFLVYFIYNVIETGNPVFPFYNTIFASKYFSLRNWLDTRFGPHKLLGVLVYPIIALRDPVRSCDIAIFEPIWCYGYIIAILYSIYYFFIKIIKKKEIDNNRLFFFISTVIIYLLWSKFQLGYTRYGFITLILGSISFYILIYDLVKNKKYFLLGIMSLLTIYNIGYSVDNYMFEKKDWIYNNYYNSYCSYKYNVKKLFTKGDENKLKFEKNSVWGIIYENAGLAQMINTDMPTINIGQSADNKYTRKLLSNRLNKANHIYSLVDSIDFDNYIEALNNYNYRITNVKYVISSDVLCSDNYFVYIFEIEKKDVETKSDLIEDEITYDTNINNMYLGISKYSNNVYKEDVKVEIIGIKDNKEKEIDTISISKDGNMKKLNYNFDEYDQIKIKSNNTKLMTLYESK